MEDQPWGNIKTRGITLIQFTKYLSHTFSDNEVGRIYASLPNDTVSIMDQVRKGAWYPFEYQRQLRQAIIQHVDPSDPLGVTYRMGLVTASWDFSGFLKPLFSFISKQTVMKNIATLWKKYYDKGKMELIDFKENYSSMELSDFPCDEYFYPIVTSWMKVAMQTLNTENPKVEYKVDKSTTGFCRFELFWE